MRVQRKPVQRQAVFHQRRQPFWDDFGIVALQIAQESGGGEGGRGFDERILRRHAALSQKRRPLAERERVGNPVLRLDIPRQRLPQMRGGFARRELHVPHSRLRYSVS